MYDIGLFGLRAEAFADRGRRPGAGRRQLAAGGSGRGQSAAGARVQRRPRSDRQLPRAARTPTGPKANCSSADHDVPLSTSDQLFEAKDYKNLVVVVPQRRAGPASDLGHVIDSVEDVRNLGLRQWQAGGAADRSAASPTPTSSIPSIASARCCRSSRRRCRRRSTLHVDNRPHQHHPRLGDRCRAQHDHLDRRWSSWSCSSSCATAGRRSSRASRFRSR